MGQQQWYRDGGTIMVGGLIGFLPFLFTFPLGRLFGGDDIDASFPGEIWQTIDATWPSSAPPPARRSAWCPSPVRHVVWPIRKVRSTALPAAPRWQRRHAVGPAGVTIRWARGSVIAAARRSLSRRPARDRLASSGY